MVFVANGNTLDAIIFLLVCGFLTSFCKHCKLQFCSTLRSFTGAEASLTIVTFCNGWIAHCPTIFIYLFKLSFVSYLRISYFLINAIYLINMYLLRIYLSKLFWFLHIVKKSEIMHHHTNILVLNLQEK